MALFCGCVAPVRVTCGVHTYIYEYCACPGVTLESISVLHWLLEVPGLLLSSCWGRGRRWGSLQWILSSALVSPLIAVDDPGNQLGVLTSYYSAERGTCASGAFLLVCPPEVMDKSRGCAFLSDQSNLPLVIETWLVFSWISWAVVLLFVLIQKSQAVRGSLLESSVRQRSRIQHVGFFYGKRGKAQWTPDGQPKQFAPFSPALTNNPLQEK